MMLNKQNLKKSNILILFLIFVVVVGLAVSFAGYNYFIKIENERSEKEFSEFVVSVAKDMIKLANESEKITDVVIEVWEKAIEGNRDFNIAIKEAMRINSVGIESIELLSKDISDKIKKMKPPKSKEADYQQIKRIDLVFNKYANMVISPSGSLMSYKTLKNELTIEIKSAMRELELTIK
jgi:hypothetical protein